MSPLSLWSSSARRLLWAVFPLTQPIMGWIKYIYSGYVLLFIFLFQPTSATENSYVENGRQVVQDFYSRYTSREVDLVFILDRSASVPRAGWESMLDFVRSLLEHFTLSHDSTRIAITSFSTHVSIDINDLEEGRENKCSMMKQIQRRLGQKVMSGYTSTNQALKKAKRILLRSRHGAKKGIFVLTDGKSNIGAVPVQASIELRSLQWDTEWNVPELGPQLEIYALGIKDAYMPELRSVASPLPNHTYFIPDFRTFEELARSIHNGEQAETWDVVSDMRLCKNRCDEHAICTCAAKSGQYVCVCKAGYYGNGYSCSECPRGTFKNTLTPHLCVPCPSNSTTMLPGATNEGNCVCQPPYHQDEVQKSCELRSCPDLPEIDYAHKFGVIGRIKDEVRDTGDACMNNPETSCHYKCIVGYRLDNHPGLICNMNGTWSGQVPRCQVVDCGFLAYHGELDDQSQVTYTNGSTAYKSMLTVSCQSGWRLFGNQTRFCTQQGIWSGTPAYCIEAKCPAVRSPVGGRVTPLECAATRQMPGTHCAITCQSGFRQQGPTERTCSDQGTWDVTQDTSCLDVEDPVITCPEDITTPVTSSNYAVVHWDSVPPRYSDNSVSSLQIQTIGVQTSPARLGVGYHQVRYIVRDSTGNQADCTQGIHVLEKVVRMEYCPDDIVITGIRGSGQEVTWRSPIFLDNNNNTIPHVCSRPVGSMFSIGTRNILCSPQETVPDLPSCVFSVTLERVKCYYPREPLHGSVSCAETTALATVCSVSCNANYDFYRPPQLMYTCINGQWNLRQQNTWWPDCSRTRLPRRAFMRSHAKYFYHGGACESMKATIAQTFEAWVQRRAFELCGADTCPLENIQVKCGEDSRKRRNAEQLNHRGQQNNEYIERKAILRYEKYHDPRYKRSLNNDVESSSTSAAEYFPVLKGKRNHGDSVQVHPTVSVTSHNEEETYRGDDVIVEESHHGLKLSPASTNLDSSTPKSSESTSASLEETSTSSATQIPLEDFVPPSPSPEIAIEVNDDVEEGSSSVTFDPLNSKRDVYLQRLGESSQVSTESDGVDHEPDLVSDDPRTTQTQYTNSYLQGSSLGTNVEANAATDQGSTTIPLESFATQLPEVSTEPGVSSKPSATASTSPSTTSSVPSAMSASTTASSETLAASASTESTASASSTTASASTESEFASASSTSSSALATAATAATAEPASVATNMPTEPSMSSSATPTTTAPPAGSPEDEDNQTVEIQFTLSRFSNVSDMTFDDQYLVVTELFTLAEGLQARLDNSSIALGEDNSSSVLVSSSFDYTDPEFEDCDPGLVAGPPKLYSKTCVLCPVGTYNTNSTCVRCPIAQFQEVEGQLDCQTCPENTTTAEEGATNSSQCREPCQPGSYSDTGLEPCSLCSYGSYQNESRSTACTDCMEEYATTSVGSTSVDDCQQYCPSGSYGRGGIQPCELCPLTSYQPLGGRSECMMCPEYKMAAMRGAVARNQCLEYDPCADNTTANCEHEGECTSSLQNGTVCICPLGLTGQRCEINVQECASNPCLNGGTCMDGIGNFGCQCSSGYTGVLCELDIDACLSSPCQNGGSCDDLEGDEGYYCYCVGSYTGYDCEMMDDCSYFECEHGETYLDAGVCTCECDDGFLGVSCDLVLDLCLTFPCQNSRRCHTFQNDFECDCLPGYTGKMCTEEIDECETEPCRNGGVCFDRVNAFYCKCPPGFTGTECQQEVSSDFDLVFNYASSANFVALEGEVIPVMAAMSVCFWTRTNQMFGSGTIFSYAVPAHEDQGTMATEFELKNVGTLKLAMKGDTATTGISLESVWWHHICLTWQTTGGSWEIYINGTRQANGVGLSDGGEIIGGGTFIIGQEQSSQGNLFNIWQSFVGEITQFNVYDELLPLSTIEALANQNQCEMNRYGTVVPWTLVLNGVYGDLEVRNQSKCLDVNECMIVGSFPCTTNHICKDTIGGYYCSGCQYGFHGNSCLEPIDECSYNLCENRAFCEDGPEPFDFLCSCRHGYTGHLCENTINYCDSNPCPAGRECLPQLGSFNCECLNSSCDDLGTACSPNPCQNNGVCSPDGNSFTCICPEGFDGTHCERTTRQCHNSPCQGRGACEFEIETGRAVCYCDLQWRGQWCEVKVRSDCSLSPCLNGGTCEDINSEIGYLCHCNEVPGVTLDANCGYADPCGSSPCSDRGMCVRLPNNTYMCDCVSGYTGSQCQYRGTTGHNNTDLPAERTSPHPVVCHPSTCQNGGSCSPSQGCVCPIEFTGSQCQVQKHTVSSYYKGTVTLLVPYTEHNKQMVESQFVTQMEQVLGSLRFTGVVALKLLSLKGSADDTKMQAEFELTHTEYMTSLDERTGYDEVRQILRGAVSTGQLGSLPTRLRGFQLKQVAKPKSTSTDSPEERRLTMYLLIGLAGSMLLLVAVSVLVICKIRTHRKRQQTLRLLPNMNNAGNINLTMLTNPVFENTEEDHRRPHGSLTEENPYAEFGEAIVPYEVTYASKSNVKDCNLVRAAARKNSESSFTSVRSSINRKDKEENSDKALVSKDYITPVVSKNELGQIEDVAKDDKKLLPNSTKTLHKSQPVLDCDDQGYLEPIKLKRDDVKGQVNEDLKGQGNLKGECQEESNDRYVKGQSEENLKGKGQENAKGEGHVSVKTVGYVNVSEEQDQVLKPPIEDNLPYIDMQTTVGRHEKNGIQFVNEETHKDSNPAPKASPIDRLAYMINKPMRSDEDAYYVEAANQIPPPEYLDVQPPRTPDVPAPDMSKRKLPPLPIQSARF